MVAQHVTANSDTATAEDITKLYACVCDMINQTLDTYGRFDLESYAQDFLERVSADA